MGVDRTAYVLIEAGAVRRFSIVNICSQQMMMPAPCLLTLGLVPQNAVQSFHIGDGVNSAIVPKNRMIDTNGANIVVSVEAITKDLPKTECRWILGIDPLIVGIGNQAVVVERPVNSSQLIGETSIKLPGQQRFITDHDMLETVSRIRVLRRPLVDRPETSPSDPIERIDLIAPTSLQQLLTDKLWEQDKQNGGQTNGAALGQATGQGEFNVDQTKGIAPKYYKCIIHTWDAAPM